jgi:neutral ceramidase
VVLTLFDLPPTTLPLCDSVRATGAAVRIELPSAGRWLLVGVPGEPTAPFSAYLRNRSPAGSDRTLILGYADEYTGYLLTAEDWLSGGYECSTNIWGPREGEQVLEALVQMAELAWSPEREDPEAGTTRHTGWEFPPVDPVEAVVTSDHGTPLTGDAPLWWPDTDEPSVDPQPAASVARAVGTARFAWLGGDPAVDFPVVVVEREIAAGQFEPLADALGRPVGSTHGAVVVTYTPAPLDAQEPAQHQYGATWQPTGVEPLSLAAPLAPLSLPLGRYRLSVTGQARAAGGIEPYALSSPAFDITAAPLDSSSSASRASAALDLLALLPAPPGLRALRDGVCDEPLPLPGPWQITVRLDDNSSQSLQVDPDETGSASVPLAPADVPRVVSVEIRDPAGNGGELAVP